MDPIKLKELRKIHGMRQSELAEIFNISQQSVSRYENGRHYPDLLLLIQIADHFNVPLDYLVGRKWPKEPVPKAYEDMAMSYKASDGSSGKAAAQARIAEEAINIISASRAATALSKDLLDVGLLSPEHAKQIREIYEMMLAAEDKIKK